MAASPYDGLYWETHIPLGLHKMLQDLTKQSFKDPNVPNVAAPSAPREWFSLPRGASSYTTKHTLYTFADAGRYFTPDGKRTTVGSNNLTPDFGFDVDESQMGYGSYIARALNNNIFNWVPVAYNSFAFPMSIPVNAAVDRAVNLILGTPGKIFLAGHGMGAIVTSKLYDEFRTGRLTSRRSDLLRIYSFGNPLRQILRGVPGSDPTGHGMAPAEDRLADTEDLVWEFSNKDDPISCQRDTDNPEAQAITAAITASATATGQELDLLVAPFGFGRIPGTYAQGTVRVETQEALGEDIELPIGTAFYTDDAQPVYFAATQDVILAAGELSVDVPVICTTAGTVGNVAADSVVNSAFTLACTNPAAMTGGTNAESDSAFRTRFANTVVVPTGTRSQWAAATYTALYNDVSSPDELMSDLEEFVVTPLGANSDVRSYVKSLALEWFGDSGAHHRYQSYYPVVGNTLSAIDMATETTRTVGAAQLPEVVNKPVTEVLSINFRQPVSISEISFESLRNSVNIELWFLDRNNVWRQMTDENSVPIAITLGSSSTVSWYKFHTMTYPIVAKSIQFRATRVPDPQMGNDPYCIGIRNILARRNVYNRPSGLQHLEDEQDPLGNVITKTIKDWDAAKAIDDNPVTFWRSEPQPDPSAVVSFYLDVRDPSGGAQMVDKIYIDPVYTGQCLNLYYSNDDIVTNRKLNPVSLKPIQHTDNQNVVIDDHYSWVSGVGLKDATENDSQTSLYETPFTIGPLISQDCWIGIQWTPGFDPFATKVADYSFNPSARTVTLTGVTSPVLSQIQSIYDNTTGTLLYAKGQHENSSTLNTGTKVLTLPVGNVPANAQSTDTLSIYYGTSGPAPTQLVLFEVDPDNTSGSQWWPKVYYDVGSASIKLEVLNDPEGTPTVYSAPIAPLFEANTPLNIVVGWTYSTELPTIHITVRTGRQLTLASYSVTDGDFPRNITLDGTIIRSNWRGILGAQIVKHEPYSTSSESFLSNPNMYCNPEPILVSPNGTAPASSLDEAVLAVDWKAQQFASGGAHTSGYTDKEWTPIWANYITEKGFLYLPRTTSMKYLKLEFTNLTAEPYPVYDEGIDVTYQVFPITVTTTTTTPAKKPDGILGTISKVFTAIGSINWLNPASIGQAINSIFGQTVQPVQTTVTRTVGPGYTTKVLPVQTSTTITETVRTEANSPWVYRRTPLNPFSLVKNFVGTLFGQNQSQTSSAIPSTQQAAIESSTNMSAPTSATPATLPIQGQDWWVFPGQLLRMPANILSGILHSQVVCRRDQDRTTRTRFMTTSVHKYETRTVTLDAAIGYFAGIREVQPYVVSYIDYEDPPEFKFDSYDESMGWSLSNINQLNSGPITAKTNPYVIVNRGFETNIEGWTATNGEWDWDNSEGHSISTTWQPGVPLIYGAAHVVADGNYKSLESQPISVTEQDQITVSGWVVYKDVASVSGGKVSVDGIGLNNETVLWSSINFNMKIDNPSGSSVPVYGVKAVKFTGSCLVPVGVNNIKLRLNVNSSVTAGDFWFDDLEMIPQGGVMGTAYNLINTKSTFSRLHCDFRDVGVKRSDSMWALAAGDYMALTPATVYKTLNISGDGETATLTIDGRPDFTVGSQIVVSDLPSGYNGMWTVTSLSITEPFTVSYACPATGNQTKPGTVFQNRKTLSAATANISRTALAYYVDTIPSVIPSGFWGDTFGGWGNKTSGISPIRDALKWGSPFATVAIQIDPNMVFDNKRVIHFYRAASTGTVETGEAGIVVRQETNFVSNGMFRICATFYKPRKTNNTVKLRLRRISGDTANGLYPYGYVHQETISDVPFGYWYTHQSQWNVIPDSLDQTYTVEIVLDGDEEEDLYLNDLWVDISHVRYHVRLGGGVNYDVTALAFADNCTVSTTSPVSQIELGTTILSDRAYAYSSKFTPLYLK